MKRVLSIILVIALIVANQTVSLAKAPESVCEDSGCCYTLDTAEAKQGRIAPELSKTANLKSNINIISQNALKTNEMISKFVIIAKRIIDDCKSISFIKKENYKYNQEDIQRAMEGTCIDPYMGSFRLPEVGRS